MRPFRRHPRLAWLALFALTAQLVLSFGHGHDARTRRDEAERAALGPCPTAALTPCSPSNPSDHDDFCPVCWTLGIAGSLILPWVAVVARSLSFTTMLMAFVQFAAGHRVVDRMRILYKSRP